MACEKCGHKSIVEDPVTGYLMCGNCGVVKECNNYDARIFSSTGFEGTSLRIGTSGAGSKYNYRENKIYKAGILIDDLLCKLKVTDSSKINEVKNMISQTTKDEFGQGDWFSVLVGACTYILMRSARKSLSVEEVARVVGCDIHELVATFEKVVNTLPKLRTFEKDKGDTIRKQGIFLMQCAIKWYLRTGRKPLPLVVAILVLVAELNNMDLTIEEVANEIYATVSTTKMRYKELLNALVKVAQILPWGNDVTFKNVLKHAPYVMEYMELKSREKPCKKKEVLGDDRIDMEEIILKVLRGNVEHETDKTVLDDVSQYFNQYCSVKKNIGSANKG